MKTLFSILRRSSVDKEITNVKYTLNGETFAAAAFSLRIRVLKCELAG